MAKATQPLASIKAHSFVALPGLRTPLTGDGHYPPISQVPFGCHSASGIEYTTGSVVKLVRGEATTSIPSSDISYLAIPDYIA